MLPPPPRVCSVPDRSRTYLVANSDHSVLRVRCAELGLFAARNAVRRPLVAARLRAPLADHVDHALHGVVDAELRLLASGTAVGGSLSAARVATPFAAHIDHSILCVSHAKLRLLAPCYAVRGMLGTPLEVAPLADDVDHARGSVGGAELCSPRPFDPEGTWWAFGENGLASAARQRETTFTGVACLVRHNVSKHAETTTLLQRHRPWFPGPREPAPREGA